MGSLAMGNLPMGTWRRELAASDVVLKTDERDLHMMRRLWVVPLTLLTACAGKGKNDVTVVPPGAPVEAIEMDPIKIAAVKGPDGTHLETYDVTELFERAGAALSEKRPADAARDYDQLLKEFPDT